jgi:CRISPR-associated protein Cmr2
LNREEKKLREADWENLLLAWMHDPADKALDIKTHVARAAKYASVVMGREVRYEEIKSALGDQMASAFERIPMPNAGQVQVSPEAGLLNVFHPLSGNSDYLNFSRLEELDMSEAYARSVAGMSTYRQKYLSLWRKLPEEATKIHPDLARIPAETRNPDHTIWQHLDTTAGVALTQMGGSGGLVLFRFQLGPVQKFIEASRSIADLITSSYLLSDLTFAAMEPVLERCGPTALVFPWLRGLARMDRWLEGQGVDISASPEGLQRAAIPNLYLAMVPATWAGELEMAVRSRFATHWNNISEAVRRRVDQVVGKEFPGWDRHWEAQVRDFFEVRVSWFERKEFRPKEFGLECGATGVRGLQLASGHGFSGEPGLWQAAVAYSARLMEAERAHRHIPIYQPAEEVGEKCTLFGSYEQMGPAGRQPAQEFWSAVHQLDGAREDAGQESDRLSAVALVKRRALRDFYRLEYGLELPELLNTHDLAQRSKDPKTAYYCLLMMDGDEMGKWLSGAKSPAIGKVLHPKARNHFQSKGCEADLEAPRPVSPALHASISAALNDFSGRETPRIVKEHGGVLIYAGGDDVLAAFPLDRGLAAAMALRKAFSAEAAMGSQASASASLVVAHHKEDLRYVLERARRGEKAAKNAGRNRLSLIVLRRNGEHTDAVATWDWIERVEAMRKRFLGMDSGDRWVYRMRAQQPVFKELPPIAFAQEMKRQIERSEKPNLEFVEDWLQFMALRNDGRDATQKDFLSFVMSAAFLARGTTGREN